MHICVPTTPATNAMDARMQVRRTRWGYSCPRNALGYILSAYFVVGCAWLLLQDMANLKMVFPAYDVTRIEKIDAELQKPSILYADFTIIPLTIQVMYMDNTALTAHARIECFYNQQFALNTGAHITARVVFSTDIDNTHSKNMIACTITDIISFENSAAVVGRLDVVRNGIIAAIRSAFARLPASTASFVHALFLGERTNLSPIIVQRFRTAGVSHLLALSGMHLAILTVLSTMVLRCFFSMRISIIGNIIFIVAYVWIIGSKPSLNRAAIMLIIWSVMNLRHRKNCVIKHAGVCIYIAYPIQFPHSCRSFLPTFLCGLSWYNDGQQSYQKKSTIYVAEYYLWTPSSCSFCANS